MNLIDKLHWRYATKRMNGQKVPKEKLEAILEAIRLSASSLGLQPYTVLIIEDEAVRQQLKAVAYNQPQIMESSHLLVFAAWSNVTEGQVDAYMQQISDERGVPLESLAGFKNNFAGIIARSADENFNWAARQAYIALGSGLVAAAVEGIDATPMEGFDNAGFDKVLNLEEKGLKSVVLLALGYRDEANDYLVNAKKIRRKKEHFFVEI
jgi:nitroreductase/dihydropteridine reductase